MKRVLALAILVLAGCGGGSGTNAAPAQPANASAAASVQIRIPNATASTAAARRAQFVGPAVAGVKLQFYLHSDTAHANPIGSGTFDVSATSSLCVPATGVRTCTLSATTLAATEDLVVTTYDAAPVAGSFAAAHQLGSGTIFGVVLSASAANSLAVAIGGTVASVVLTPGSQSLTGTTAGTYTLAFTAYDAASEMIVAGTNTVSNGSGNTDTDTFSNPIVFSVGETGGSGHTSLSLNGGAHATTVTALNSSDTIVVHYDGAATNGYSASVSATATGVTTQTASLSLVFGGKIYVADADLGSTGYVLVFAAGPSGTLNEAPVATIAGASTLIQYVGGIGVDANGLIYVTDGTGKLDIFPANPSGTINEAPEARLTGLPGMGYSAYTPQGIAFDANNRIYIADNGFGGGGYVTVYAANPTGTSVGVPITGAGTGLIDTSGVAIDPSGNVIAANYDGSIAAFYPVTCVTMCFPNQMGSISGTNTGGLYLGGNYGVATDASGRIYSSNCDDNSVTVYAANPTGNLNEAPLATIQGSNTGLSCPKAIALDATGEIYVVNSTPPGVIVFAANPVGTLNETPLATITGNNTSMVDPVGIAIH